MKPASPARSWRNSYGMRAVDQQLHVRITGSDMAAAAAALGLQPPYRYRVIFALVEPGLAEVRQFASMPLEERESRLEQALDPYPANRPGSRLG